MSFRDNIAACIWGKSGDKLHLSFKSYKNETIKKDEGHLKQ
jgi:hypothetical protein